MRAVLLALALVALAGPGVAAAPEMIARFGPVDAPRRMLIRSTTDVTVFAPVIGAFLTTRPDLAIDYEQWGSNDLYALSMEDCTQGRAGADLVISSGVQQMVKLVNDACARSYRSAATAVLPDALSWRDQLWGVTREPAVMVYNKAQVPPAEVPRSRFDLLDLLRPERSRYAGRVATYDIEESGLGYLFAFMDAQEATTFGGLLESLGRSGAVATCCSAEIIDGVATGQYLVAYNVLGSYALARAAHDDRIGVVAPSDYTLVLNRAVMIPREAVAFGSASGFLDFLLSADGRAALRRALLIVPVEEEAGVMEVPPASDGVLRPIPLSPALLVAMDKQKREAFIRRWRDTFPGVAGPE